MNQTLSPGLALVLSLLALACDAAVFVPVEPDAGDVDPPDGGPMGCGRLRPQRPTTPDEGAPETRVYILRDTELFPPGTEWTTIGYDLDATCSTAEGPFSCVNDAAAAVDGEQGIDNAWGARLATTIQTQYASFEGQLRAVQQGGQYGVAIRVSGWNGTANDPLVEVDFAQTVCGVPDGSVLDCSSDPLPVPLWDGNDTFFLADTAFLPMLPTEPRVRDTAGYVRDGVLVARLPDHENLEFSSGTSSLRMGLSDASITMTIFPEASEIPGAVLAGRWAKSDILATAALLGICPGDPFSSAILGILTNSLNAAADVRSDTASDGMGVPCDAVSISLRATAYAGRWGGGIATPPLPDPCI